MKISGHRPLDCIGVTEGLLPNAGFEPDRGRLMKNLRDAERASKDSALKILAMGRAPPVFPGGGARRDRRDNPSP